MFIDCMVALYTIWASQGCMGLPSSGTLDEQPADAGQGASQATQAAQALTCMLNHKEACIEHADSATTGGNIDKQQSEGRGTQLQSSPWRCVALSVV